MGSGSAINLSSLPTTLYTIYTKLQVSKSFSSVFRQWLYPCFPTKIIFPTRCMFSDKVGILHGGSRGFRTVCRKLYSHCILALFDFPLSPFFLGSVISFVAF